MQIELCDLCGKRVNDLNKTEVIIKDYKGLDFDYRCVLPARRKLKGVICDGCLSILKANVKKG